MNKNDFDILRWKNFHKENDLNLKKINQYVSKNSGWKSINKCPICDSIRKKILFKKFGINILNCLSCNHIYSHKAPKNGNFLDYGCGTGWLIEHAKSKFKNIEGYEPTKKLAEITSKKLNINVFNDFRNRRSNKYDIITLYDVIEHILNPKKFVNDIHKMMNKNALLVIYTPNSASISFDYLKEKSNLIIPPLHLHFFNYDSLNHLLKKNFKILYTETKGFDIGDIYSYQKEKNIKTFVKNFKDMETIQDNLDNMFLGNHIRFILKKR